MSGMIDFFNEQVEQYRKAIMKSGQDAPFIDEVIDNNPRRISWSRGTRQDVVKLRRGRFDVVNIRPAFYRPFVQHHLYLDRQFNDMVYRIPQIFPSADSENPSIYISGPGGRGSSALMIALTPDLNLQHSGGQCFPLRIFGRDQVKAGKLDLGTGDGIGWRYNISDHAHKEFQNSYCDNSIGKEDIFYYVYGILHSPEYKQRFAADLRKMLPRIPYAENFWAFSKAGRKLADLHLNYERIEAYPVEKMYFGKRDKKADKTTIHYNSHITLTGIPLEAYEYVVNGKPAIEWIMERYQIAKDKDSGIVNDPNDWALEHNDPEYVLRLLKSLITVSIETMKIVNSLSPLNAK